MKDHNSALTRFVLVLFLTNQDVINTSEFSVAMSCETDVQLTTENRCTFPLTGSLILASSGSSQSRMPRTLPCTDVRPICVDGPSPAC